MIKVNYTTTKSERSGRSIYEREIRKRLKNLELNIIEYIPAQTKTTKVINKLLKFPYRVKKRIKKENITHITSEDLAYLLNFIKLKKTIITCHDLSRWVYYKKSLFWRFNIRGLKKADRIITVSNFSKNEIAKHLGYPEDKISVINDAVDHNHYYQKRDKEILKKYNIPENEKVILYVGSEQPRLNVPFLIKGFAELKKLLPGAKLLKIGNPQWPKAREKLEKLIRELNLKEEVIFLGHVPPEELPKFYNAADLFVYPSLYAGFGLPPLEAMACGTPVITSNTSSFPEVVGDAGIMVNPFDVTELTKAMFEILTKENLRENLIKKGLERAKMFSWEKSAKETLEVYKKLARS
jgi:glycosyltransferase involved in cell wall biosynthesis